MNKQLTASYQVDAYKIVHLGVGNFHRSHQAVYVDAYMRQSEDFNWGIIGIGIHPSEKILHTKLKAQQGLYSLVTKNGESFSRETISALTRFIHVDNDYSAAISSIASKDTTLITLTVTEGGYYINQQSGHFLVDETDIQQDLQNNAPAKTIYKLLIDGLLARVQQNSGPVTIMSCDNIASNGTKLKQALYQYCEMDSRLNKSWLDENTSFPNTMVDRITPQTTIEDINYCKQQHVIDACPVPAESFKQWIIEDNFCAERPMLEEVGVQIVADVSPYEHCKLRLLNASHQALAYVGLLLGYETVSQAINDKEINQYIRTFLQQEASFELSSLPGLSVDGYQETVCQRFANEAIEDTLQRIVCYSSDRIMAFVMPLFSDLLASGQSCQHTLFILATWMQFCNRCFHNDEPVIDNQIDLMKELVVACRMNPAGLFDHLYFTTQIDKINSQVREHFGEIYKAIELHGPKYALRTIIA